MNPKSAIAKGKELERFLCDELRSCGVDTRATRTPGSGSGKLKSDIDTDCGWSFEAKNTKNASLPEWWRQTLRQVNGYNKPSVVWHPPQQPMTESVIIIRWADFKDLLVKSREPAMINPDRTTAWKLNNLIKAAKDLLKELNV